MSTRETNVALAVGALVLLGVSKAKAGNAAEASRSSADADDALVRRANQTRAQYWAGEFEAFGVSRELARALARWAGLESGGDPLALSPIGERGLLQSTRTTALREGAFTPAEWEELQNRQTQATRHADLAVRFSRWIWARAARHVRNPPSDPASIAWYSKLYHARPRDLASLHAEGDALPIARRLEEEWAADPKALHRLHAANVVAWGVVRP